MAKKAPDVGNYQYGFHDEDVSIFRSQNAVCRKYCPRNFEYEK